MRRALIALVVLAAACGGDGTTLSRAEDAMADLDAGTMRFELSATTPDAADPVGFGVEGSFSSTGDGELPLMDFTYTERLAGIRRVTELRSDGSTVWVAADGEVIELAGDDVSSLRLGDDEGFADLGIASWVEDPTERERGGATVITGSVDAGDLLGDIVRLVSQAAAAGDVGPLEADAAERLAGLVRSSDIEVVVGEGHLPRSVEATLGFGADAPGELVEVLGPYAAAQLRVTVELAPLDGELRVEAPGPALTSRPRS